MKHKCIVRKLRKDTWTVVCSHLASGLPTRTCRVLAWATFCSADDAIEAAHAHMVHSHGKDAT